MLRARFASRSPLLARVHAHALVWLAFVLALTLLHEAPAMALSAAPTVQSAEKALQGSNDKNDKNDKSESAEEDVAPDSPRASMARFLAATSDGRWADAATYLELARSDATRGQELARRLSFVLNRKLWLDPELLSAQSAGRKDDRLPSGIDEVGRIQGKDGKSEPVRLVRREARSQDDEARWIFSAQTVSRIDVLYESLDERWFREHLPAGLLREGPGSFLYFQLLALPLLAFACHFAGRPLAWLLIGGMGRLARRTPLRWDEEVAKGMRGPARLAATLPLLFVATRYLALYQPAEALLHRIGRALLLAAVFWFALRVLAAFGGSVLASDWGAVRPSLRSFSWLSLRVARIVVWTVGGIVVLSQLGYPVGSIITGLGIGGIAIALAAQKTVENLFGSVSILVDQPFRVGDAIKVDGIEGTVENIGLRSTRIRTAERSLVVLANGKLADMRTECLSARDRTRFACKLRLSTKTTTAQLGELVRLLELTLGAHPKVRKEDVLVRFTAVGDGVLEVDASCTVETTVFTEFATARQDLLLGCLEATARAGVELATREPAPPPVPAAS